VLGTVTGLSQVQDQMNVDPHSSYSVENTVRKIGGVSDEEYEARITARDPKVLEQLEELKAQNLLLKANASALNAQAAEAKAQMAE